VIGRSRPKAEVRDHRKRSRAPARKPTSRPSAKFARLRIVQKVLPGFGKLCAQAVMLGNAQQGPKHFRSKAGPKECFEAADNEDLDERVPGVARWRRYETRWPSGRAPNLGHSFQWLSFAGLNPTALFLRRRRFSACRTDHQSCVLRYRPPRNRPPEPFPNYQRPIRRRVSLEAHLRLR